jgi:hypothetical protein
MASLEDALGDAIERANERELQTAPIEQTYAMFGTSSRTQNPAMAMALAGTSDKSSREYRNAMRQVQRWRAPAGKQRRAPSAAARRRLAATAPKPARPQAPQKWRQQGAGIKVTGRPVFSAAPELKPRTIDKGRNGGPLRLDADQLGPVLDAWDAGDPEAAADMLVEAIGDEWGAALEDIEDVTELEMD